MTEGKVARLLALQELDLEIRELERRREAVPVRRAEVAGDITALEDERTGREATLERVRLDRRSRETELEAEQEKRDRYEGQLNEVKTNVAYSALLTEIGGAKKSISKLEDEIVELMEAREENEARIAEIDAELEEKRAAAAEELGALEREEAEIATELEALGRRRAALAADVDPNLLRLYERLRRGDRFPAVVPLRGQACGSCHGHLPPQLVREVHHDDALHACEACGVLVYAPREGAGEDADEPATEPASGARG